MPSFSAYSFHTMPFETWFTILFFNSAITYYFSTKKRKRIDKLEVWAIFCLVINLFSRSKKYCCPLAENRTFSRTSRLRGRELQYVSSRPRTSFSTLLCLGASLTCRELPSVDKRREIQFRHVCVHHAFTRVVQQTRVSSTCNQLFSSVKYQFGA